MPKLKAIDMRLLDEVFSSPSGPGYVLDFSNHTFSQFFINDIGIDIDDQKYCTYGTSKGKRLRAFLNLGEAALVAKALRALWDYREGIYGPAKNENDRHQQSRFFKLVDELEGPKPSGHNPKTSSTRINPSPQAIAELNTRFFELMKLKAQERGFAFERFLSDLFALYELDPRRSFRTTGEQIDGSFVIPPETFLFEAKWQDKPVDQADLLTFSGKVEGKAQWSRGLFISYSGFSMEGLEAFLRGRRTAIICMDGLDLAHVLSNQLSLIDVISKKKRRAAETGSAFVPVRELFSGIT